MAHVSLSWRTEDKTLLLSPDVTKVYKQLTVVSSRFLLESSVAQLETLTHTWVHPLICPLMAFTVQSIFSSMTIILPHTRQWHLKTRNTVFYRCNTHQKECQCQFLLQRLILVTLDKQFSAQSGTTVVPSQMVVSFHGDRKLERREASFSSQSYSYQVVLGNFLGAGRFGSVGKQTNICSLLPQWLSVSRSD